MTKFAKTAIILGAALGSFAGGSVLTVTTLVLVAASHPQGYAGQAVAVGASAFRSPADKGVGDTIHRLAVTTGAQKVADKIAAVTKKPCGCKLRQTALNKAMPYGPTTVPAVVPPALSDPMSTAGSANDPLHEPLWLGSEYDAKPVK